ncbi:MAG: ferredoxin [Gracilibacter sp. BRH_c7a]|nr:MAG: ferredoxin [Gracilibacter sp. BRH_c7a]
MKAAVDQELCIGCGVCEGVCPEVFQMNDEGLAEAIKAEIDQEVLEEAKQAQTECPVEAITIE